MLLCIVFISCNAQEDKNRKPKDENKVVEKGTNPKEEIRVNKKYDSKGNLVRFDSTYSYTYSSKGKDSSRVALDTMIQRFKKLYNADLSVKLDREFKNMFLTDSLFKYDLPNDDYFSKRFELNMKHMQEMMQQLDSLKTSFLREPPAGKNGRSKT